MAIRHAGYWKPKFYPKNGDIAPGEWDRGQDLRGTPTLPVDQHYEIGRYDKLCSRKRPPEVALALRQFEYGSLETYNLLANKPSATDTLTLADFDDSFTHLAGYEGSDENTLEATIVFPNSRLNGFGLSIPSPEDIVERTFDLTADTKHIWQNDNKYFVYKRFAIASGNMGSGNISTVTISDPAPVQDPDTNEYLWKVYRVRSGETEELELTTDYTYTPGTGELVIQASQVGDVIKVYYTSSSYISGEAYHSLNDVDPCVFYASYASVYLTDGVTPYYLERLGSLTLDVTFDRQDVPEIGSTETVETGIRTRTVTVNLTGFVKDYTLEEILRGVYGTNYGKIDIEKFLDTLSLVIKFYETSDKNTFKIGYQSDNLSVSGLEKGVPVNDFITKSITLETDNLTITTNESNLAV